MRKRLGYLAWPVLALLALTSATLAQTGDGYDLTWWTVDGGGHTYSTGGGYELASTIGQSDAGLLTGGDYMLQGGFWGEGAAATRFRLYLPLTLRGQ
ncbi:MAG: hypothetical protein ACP5JJ_08845 [Anaerolineae bacterium]